MKSILISIKPEWVANILNGYKTIEIRKTAPKCDLPIEVYIYCTKGSPTLMTRMPEDDYVLNGKVVAKFTLRKVERFIEGLNETEYEHLPNFALKEYDYYGLEALMKKACINDDEITKYAPDLSFYAWHISDLEIFDEPMKLSDFYTKQFVYDKQTKLGVELHNRLDRAPQSWCYVEEKR